VLAAVRNVSKSYGAESEDTFSVGVHHVSVPSCLIYHVVVIVQESSFANVTVGLIDS
jgi:hypothetical protein